MKTCLFCLCALCAFSFSLETRATSTLEPSGKWRIYSEGANTKTPTCVAQIEMSNGFILAFSGPKGSLSPAQTLIDFRQNIFAVGQAYSARLSVPGESATHGLLGRGTSTSILSIPLPKSESVMTQIKNTQTMILDVEDNTFAFSLPGIKPVLADFGTCGPMNKDSVPSVDSSSISPNTAPLPIVASAKDLTPDVKSPIKTSSSSVSKKPPTKTQTLTADFVKDSDMTKHMASGEGSAGQLAALRRDVEILTARNLRLEKELEDARRDLSVRRDRASGKDWSTEEATMRYQESERQVRRLGDQLERERLACQREKEDVEALLFDPAVTEQKQLVKLADMEQKLEAAKQDADLATARCEAKTQNLERQLRGTSTR